MSYMPSTNPSISTPVQQALLDLGQALRGRRKGLKLSAASVAEAAGVSRTTLHRVEKGAPSVTLGACAAVASALGWALEAGAPDSAAPLAPSVLEGWVPVRIALADYPQLRALAWHVHGVDALTPGEALDIYERNARHLDEDSMGDAERALLTALRNAFGTRSDRV